jgi:hypothetical protein
MASLFSMFARNDVESAAPPGRAFQSRLDPAPLAGSQHAENEQREAHRGQHGADEVPAPAASPEARPRSVG